jgi:hypothetical protein
MRGIQTRGGSSSSKRVRETIRSRRAKEEVFGLMEAKELFHDKEQASKRLRTDSASAYAFYTDFFTGFRITDIVDRAASCPTAVFLRKRMF